jgi:RsiW-degrading membrane proteinase PrsW (M82 family)
LPHPTGFPPLSAVVIVLICAGLLGALYQALFPRPARWPMVLLAAVLGGALTVSLTYLLTPTGQRLSEIHDLWSALKVVVLTVGLPEEAVKGLGALIAILAFRRSVTPASAFQAALFAALGFAVVENALYARAFAEVSVLIAFGRGIIASFIHSTMMMIQGAFLAKFVRSNFKGLHWPVIGWLAAAAAHASFDWGMLQPLAKYFEMTAGQIDTATVEMEMARIVMQNLPVLVIGIPAPFLVGLWLFRRALRTAGIEDPRMQDPAYVARVARWHRVGNALLVLGVIGLVGSVAAAIVVSVSGGLTPPAATPDPGGGAELRGSLLITIALIASPAALILGWLLRQKR